MTLQKLAYANLLAKEIKHITELLFGYDNPLPTDKIITRGHFVISDGSDDCNPVKIDRSSEEGKQITEILKALLTNDMKKLDDI